MRDNKEYEEILLFSSLNDYQINEVCAILTENNIPFIRKDDGVGSYMNLYMGHSYQEKSVFVSKNDFDKAFNLISIFTANEIEAEEMVEEENVTKSDRDSNTLTLISKIAICTVLILPILLIILMIILTIFQ